MSDRCFQPEIENASREKLREIQTETLIKMVKRCYDNVPFYKDRLTKAGISPSDIKSIDDIKKLPFTTKEDLRENYPYGMFASPREDIVRIHATSGTTGKQTVIGYTKHDMDIWSNATARAIVAAGGKKSDIIHVSYGYGLFTGGLGLHDGAAKADAAVIPVSSGNTKRQVQILKDFESDIICCTPSYAVFIGEMCREMGIDTKELPLRAGIFGAEAWSENMRAEIEKMLNIKAYDIYGLAEITGPGVAYECSHQNGMHICEDYFYPEIIDPDTGETLPDGEYGELVFTSIAKEALPLIRYRTRDICALSHEPCACGRTLVKMMKLKGRTDDMLIIRGINVFPSQVEHVLLELGMEPNYQIEVDRKDNLDIMTVKIEMSEKMFSDEIKKTQQIENNVKSALSGALNITASVKLVEPKSIQRSEGKAKRVIDNRNI